ncbi:MAG: hypothetical protein ABJN42_29775 [Roseibium sp.]|uniref:hypothetical protein n=1 Tax=Roseibium sp. TaxID=1936156 RepID=UPI003298BC21
MNFPIAPTPENIAAARDFVFEKWNERAAERGLAPRSDLSGSCKFSSLFAQTVFGTSLQGNYHHQFGVLADGTVLDLNAEARDVQELDNPWVHDPDFWENPEHIESLESCAPRVAGWIKEFEQVISEPDDTERGFEP